MRSRPFRPALGALSLALALVLPSPTRAQNKWVSLAPFPEPREEVLGVAANGKVYVFTGLLPGWKPAAIVYEYDPATNAWTKKKPMALPSHHVAFAEAGGKIYAFGGFVPPPSGAMGWTPIDNAWEYDPGADAWKALAPMPTKRGAAAAAAVNGKIYVIGGATLAPGATQPYLDFKARQNVLGTVEEYDPAANSWRARASMPTPRNHVAIGAINGKIYVAGGRVGAPYIGLSSDISVTEVYDPAADQWGAVLARMPTARSAMAYGVHGGRLLTAGGEWQDPTMQAVFRSFEAYDPATNTWTTLPPMALARHGLAGAVVGNRFYAISGDLQSAGTGQEMSTKSVDAFEFATATAAVK